jgi:group I intron endonuclease
VSVIRLDGAIRSECLEAKAHKPKASVHAVSEGASAPSFIFSCGIRSDKVRCYRNQVSVTEIKWGYMTRGIYKIINVVNNKFYVGSAVDLKRRKAQHFSKLRTGKHNNRHLQATWLKYGEQAFVFAVVEELPDDADLLAAENVWLKEHVGKSYCYNVAIDAVSPGRGMGGEKHPMWGKTFSHTVEAKAKMAAASTGRPQSEKSIAATRARLIGKPKSTEVRAKISATMSGEGNYWFGKKRPDHSARMCRAVAAISPDGCVTNFVSIKALMGALALPSPTVNSALKSGKQLVKGVRKGWSFKYIDRVPTE